MQKEIKEEIKYQIFVRLAERRVTRVIKDLRLIGNLSNKRIYSYKEDDIKMILSAIESATKNLKSRFAANLEDKEKEFKL